MESLQNEIVGHRAQVQGRRRSTLTLLTPPGSPPTLPALASSAARTPSPPPLALARPSRSSPRTSLTSVKRMPMITEDEMATTTTTTTTTAAAVGSATTAPIFTTVLLHRRSMMAAAPARGAGGGGGGVFYRYGEDYITPWHLVGVPPSPSPSPSRVPAGAVGRGRRPDAKQGGWRRLRELRRRSWL